MRYLAAAALMALGVGAQALADSAGTPSVTAAASKTDVTVGETFTVEVTASGPAGTAWTFPAEAGDEQVELRPAQAPDTGERPAGMRRYEAAAFALGEVRVPPIEVRYRLPDGTSGAVSTAAIPLRILSVLPKDPKEQKLADIRGPVGVGVGRAFWLAAAATGLLLAGFAFALWRRLRRRTITPEKTAPAVPPDTTARLALDRLAGSSLLARGEYRAFYIELADVAKRYLEARLSAPVLEMTSAETVAFLRDHPAGRDLATTVREVARAADRVKFARGEGVIEEAERHLASVRGMVTALEERLRPAPQRTPRGWHDRPPLRRSDVAVGSAARPPRARGCPDARKGGARNRFPRPGPTGGGTLRLASSDPPPARLPGRGRPERRCRGHGSSPAGLGP